MYQSNLYGIEIKLKIDNTPSKDVSIEPLWN